MVELTSTTIKNIEPVFEKLLKNPNVRFVSLVNKMGKCQLEKKQKNKKLILDGKKARTMYMQLSLELSMREELNRQLGKLKYLIGFREKIDIITIPYYNYLIFISVEANKDCNTIVKSTLKLLGKIKKK